MRISSRRSQTVTAVLALALAPVGLGCTINAAGPGPVVGVPGAGLEPNVDRPGSDYRSFDLAYPRAEDCQNACMAEPQCLAFTYVNPGVQGPSARCWLKNQVPTPVANACCVSGAKFGGGQPVAQSAWVGTPPPEAAPPAAPPPSAWQGVPPAAGGGLEPGVDRPGMDYRSFDLGYPRPDDCRNACLSEPQCVAFTYVNPGVQRANARCWLKGQVPQPVQNNCCVSGVK
jgi:hypothetical protein